MSPHPSPVRQLLKFLLAVFTLSIPFIGLGYWLRHRTWKAAPVNLPASALMAFNPAIVAVLLTYRRQGGRGVVALLKTGFDFHKIENKLWYIPILLLRPSIMVLSYAILRRLGRPLPEAQISLRRAALLAAGFYVAALGEEIGWQGYLFEPLYRRWGALKTSLALGVGWAAWHVIPYFQAHRNRRWIIWQCLNSVALRVLITWVYLRSGSSVAAAVLFHAMSNLGDFLFPHYGSHYDPQVTGTITGVAAGLSALGWRSEKK